MIGRQGVRGSSPLTSTGVPDVVADYGTLVHLAAGPREFVTACRHVRGHSRTARDHRLAAILRGHEWDSIAADLAEILRLAAARPAAAPPAAASLHPASEPA